MATKTLACPECGSEAAPGRYACTECGALLNGVAVRPRLPAPQPVARNGSKPRSKSGSASASRPPSGHVPLLDAEPEPESELERFAPALPPAVPSTFGSVAAPHETLIDDPSHDWDPIALDDELEPAEKDVVAPEATSSLQVETGAE